jgi:hypothetical protein
VEDNLVHVGFQERCEDQHISDSDVLRHVLSVLFARPHSADHALLVAHRLGRKRRRGWVAYAVKGVGRIRSGFGDLFHNILVRVVKDVFRSVGFDYIEVARTAGGDDVKAIHFGDLNRKDSHGCCALKLATVLRMLADRGGQNMR